MEGGGILWGHTIKDADNQARGWGLLSAKVPTQLLGRARLLLGEKKFLFCGWGWTHSCETSANSPGPHAYPCGKKSPRKIGKRMDVFYPFRQRLKDKSKTHIAAATPNSFLWLSLSIRGALRVVPYGWSRVLRAPCWSDVYSIHTSEAHGGASGRNLGETEHRGPGNETRREFSCCPWKVWLRI